MDQLLALDTLFLGLETETVQANIGGVSVLEGPAPTIDELRRQALGALEQLPRYRQRIREVPSGLGRPLWIDDDEFDIARHLTDADLGAHVSFDSVCDFFADVMSARLDRDHPLWKIQIVRGLPGGRWSILWTVHHAMVDGIAATELMALLLAPDRDARAAAPAAWRPHTPPPALNALRSTLSAPAGPIKPLHDISRAVRAPGRFARAAATTARGMIPVGRAVFESGESPLNCQIGAGRIWRTTELDLDEVKLAGRLRGGTVNDVVLTAVAGGLREFLVGEGADLEACRPRTMVPVSIRTQDEQGLLANRVSAVFVELPVELEGPSERLAEVRRQMDELKRRHGETTAEVLGDIANYVPHVVLEAGERTVLRLADVKRFFNTITTNVPGPQMPLYCLGREMLSLHPYVMLMKDLRVSTAVLSYNGAVYFGVTGDRSSEPDVERICAGINSSLLELLAMPGAEPAHGAA